MNHGRRHREYNEYQVRGSSFQGATTDDIVFSPYNDFAVNFNGVGAVDGASFGVESVDVNLLITAWRGYTSATRLDMARQALPIRIIVARDYHPQRWTPSYTPDVYLKSILFHDQDGDTLTHSVYNNNIEDEFHIIVDEMRVIPEDTTGAVTVNPGGIDVDYNWTSLNVSYRIPCDFVTKCTNTAGYAAKTSGYRTENYCQANQLWVMVMHNGYQGLTLEGIGRDLQPVRASMSSKVRYHSF